GPREVAFMLGGVPYQTISFAEPDSGRVVRTIAPEKGPIDSVSCSPDGKTVYFAAQGVIWSMPTAGDAGGVRKIRAGDSVVADPSGQRLVVQAQVGPQLHLYVVFLDGRAEREIPADPSNPVSGFQLCPNALSADGRLLVTLLLQDSWFNPAAVID